MAARATVRLDFPPQSQLLSTIRLMVSVLARKAGLDDEGIEDLKVAVSETCAVAMEDLAHAGLQAPIGVEITHTPSDLTVVVVDQAPDPRPPQPDPPAPQPQALARPDAAEVNDRQLGLALVNALVRDLRCEILAGGGHRTSFSLPLPAPRWPRPSLGPGAQAAGR